LQIILLTSGSEIHDMSIFQSHTAVYSHRFEKIGSSPTDKVVCYTHQSQQGGAPCRGGHWERLGSVRRYTREGNVGNEPLWWFLQEGIMGGAGKQA
jgi:hypothetical protein